MYLESNESILLLYKTPKNDTKFNFKGGGKIIVSAVLHHRIFVAPLHRPIVLRRFIAQSSCVITSSYCLASLHHPINRIVILSDRLESTYHAKT